MTGFVWRASMQQRLCGLALSVVFLCSVSTTAHAEVHVEGSPAAVRLTTSRDKISDVLSALAATFKIQYRAAISLDAAADAAYSGSFQQVISRLLEGYNYVIKTDDSKTTEIVVFGKRGGVIIPPKAPPDKPEVASVQSKPEESSATAVKSSAAAVELCMSMGNVKLSRKPSKRRVISRTYTCMGDLAKNLKLALDEETKETLEGLGRRYAPRGARAKTIEYKCPETDRCVVTVKY